ncbi:MAG: penicillin-binding protein 2 [Candidatus Babeliales bacterium]|jgi:cell division protein FtsI (penicillin-binding protein 3)
MIKKQRDYKIRLGVVLILFGFLFTIVLIRLFLLQIYRKNFFRVLASQQYNFSVKVNLPRGEIFDRSGQELLAFNRSVPSAFILPHQFTEQKKTENFLKRFYSAVYKKMKARPDKHFLWLDRVLTDDQVEDLKKKGTSDIQFIDEPRRFYFSPSSAHLIGFTDIDSKGISGIELEFEKWLGGKPMQITIQKDARSKNFYFGKEIEKAGYYGKPIKLTIDKNIQNLAFEELESAIQNYQAESGSVLVLDPENGHVLAMTNYPSFDPNQKNIQKLDITKNFIVSECFELGSVMKAFLALAALAEGVVTLDEIFDCQGKIAYVNGVKVENWKSLGELSFADVIKFSSNVGVAKVVMRLGPKLYDHLKKVGFGTKTGIEFPGERDGFVNPPKNWSRSSPIVMSFGYEIMASLLQLGRAFCIFSNGGYLVNPTLVIEPKIKPEIKNKTSCHPELVSGSINCSSSKIKLYDDNVISKMREILSGVGNLHPIRGCTVMGKTGTARCAIPGGYSDKEHIYTFVGILEKGDYKRVIVTFVNRPQKTHLWASEVAAPLFQRVAERMLIYESADKREIMI